MSATLTCSKTCSKCLQKKSSDEFRKQTASKDGLQSWCKACQGAYNAAYNHQYYVSNSELWKEYGRRKMSAIKSDPIAFKIYKAQAAARVKKLRQSSPHLTKAHNAVNHAIFSGKLVRPKLCSQCKCKCKPEAHHDSYDDEKLLDVRWLCKACHEYHHHNNR